VQPLLVVAHACLHQQHADFVFHLHHLADQQVAVPQRAPPFTNRRRSHIAFRQKITPRVIANLGRIDVIVLLSCRRNSPQHQGMGYLQCRVLGLQVIVDPPRKNRSLHRCGPRPLQCFHPMVQVQAGGGNRTFGVNRATCVLHAEADSPLVNIQSEYKVCMGEPPWCF
jgi:hypothetical protein